MKHKALIVSIKGIRLSKKKKFTAKEKPWGVILFKRNLKSVKQIKSLIFRIKYLTKNIRFPIIVDEEGENVSRLKDIINHKVSANFGNLLEKDETLCLKFKTLHNFHKQNFENLGININTIPVLDVLRKNTNKIIGNRSFSKKNNSKSLGSYCQIP